MPALTVTNSQPSMLEPSCGMVNLRTAPRIPLVILSASLVEPDVLFLIPAVWVGPVLAPSLIALSMSVAAWVLWPMDYRVIAPRAWEWALMAVAGVVLVATFIVPAASAGVTHLGEGISLPEVSYPWWGWMIGEGTAVFLAVRWWMRGRAGHGDLLGSNVSTK